jgi:hypothetical protein
MVRECSNETNLITIELQKPVLIGIIVFKFFMRGDFCDCSSSTA